MQVFHDYSHPKVVQSLQRGGIGILLTDTLYGVVASAHSETAVERLYAVRGRDRAKPCIVLIDSIDQSWEDYSAYRHLLARYWPGKVSIVLPATHKTPVYIHRGVRSVAYRMPDKPELRALLRRTGPLLAPSANTQGMPPAMNIAEAKSYFGDRMDFYIDSGTCQSTDPSQVVRLSVKGDAMTLRGK